MKVWEAQQILEGMDPQAEVTLTIGRQRQMSKEPWPYREHVGTHFYRQYPQWVGHEDRQIGYDNIRCH